MKKYIDICRHLVSRMNELWTELSASLHVKNAAGETALTGLRIITFDRRRFFATLSGIGIAIVILFVEQGFFFAIVDSQTRIAEIVRGDLIVLHKARTNLNKWTSFDSIRLAQITAHQSVESANGLYQGTAYFSQELDSDQKRILVYAVASDAVTLEFGSSEEAMQGLRTHGTLLYDKLSRNLYGDVIVGQDVYINNSPFLIGGTIALGPNFVHDGAVLMSAPDWLKLAPSDRPIMGIIRLKDGVSVSKAAAMIRASIPDDVVILTPGALQWREFLYTVQAAPIGLLFAVGFLAGIAVGTGVCTQTLYNEVHDRRAQYATLKAMGFPPLFLIRLVTSQSLALTLGGFVAGLCLAFPVFAYISSLTGLPVHFTFGRILFVAFVAGAMSLLASWLALLKVAKNDPASLY